MWILTTLQWAGYFEISGKRKATGNLHTGKEKGVVTIQTRAGVIKPQRGVQLRVILLWSL